MTVQRICAAHGRYVGRECPTCRADRASRTKRRTRAEAIRSGQRWKNLQRTIVERDGRRCTFGLEIGEAVVGGRCPVVERLQAHHRVPIEDGGPAYDPQNLRAVCATHHARLEQAYREEQHAEVF